MDGKYKNFTPKDCIGLNRVLGRNAKTNPGLSRVILTALVCFAAINLGIALFSCTVPRQRMSYLASGILLVGPISVVVPFMFFDNQLQAMDLSRFRPPDFSSGSPGPPYLSIGKNELWSAVDRCKSITNSSSVPKYKDETTFPTKLNAESTYYFGSFPRQFQIAVLFCSIATVMVGIRSCFMQLRGATLEELDEEREYQQRQAAAQSRIERRRELLDRAEQSSADLGDLLEQIRVDKTSAKAVAANQCIICLEDIGEEAVAVLQCGHAFHEQCIGDWLRVSRRRECPICKAAIELTADDGASAVTNVSAVSETLDGDVESAIAPPEETDNAGDEGDVTAASDEPDVAANSVHLEGVFVHGPDNIRDEGGANASSSDGVDLAALSGQLTDVVV